MSVLILATNISPFSVYQKGPEAPYGESTSEKMLDEGDYKLIHRVTHSLFNISSVSS